MNISKPGRPAKTQLRCNLCKSICPPKNGDWFFASAQNDQQVFLCRSCERQPKSEYKRTMPVR